MKKISVSNKEKYGDIGINKNSWVMCSVSSLEEPVVIYIDENTAKDDFVDFSEFVEFYKGELILGNLETIKSTGDEIVLSKSEANETVTSNNRVKEVATTNVQILKWFPGGLDDNDLLPVIEKLKSRVESIESNESLLVAESNEAVRNPYATYGVKKSDFA